MKSLAFLFLLPAALLCQTPSSMVRFHTNFGDIDVTLLPNSAPRTVTNFLNYVNRGAYNNSLIHRSVAGFIIQGGGYQFINRVPREIASDPPVVNEFSVSNTRGTIAMAKLGSSPNSATNQWFFNLADNSRNLNSQNGGFTVFGRVANTSSLAVIDRIAAVPTPAVFASPFDQMPLLNYRGGEVTEANVVLVTSIEVLNATPVPAIAENGVISASSFGGFREAAPGSFIEIYGSNLAGTSRSWAGADFVEGKAPTSLEGVTVTVNGRPAFVAFVSPAQVNVQVPGDVPAGGSVPVIVSYQGQASAPVMLPVKPLAGGLLAPAALKVNDVQYVAAYGTSSAVTTSAPARPGETLVFYGVGFGPVTPGTVAGQIAQGLSSVSTPIEFQIGGVKAEILYAGLVPEFTGLYQFNVTVPANAPAGDLPVRVLMGGEPIGQTLSLPVRAAN
jgi:uncharacterized protein (TIGR03437 family)